MTSLQRIKFAHTVVWALIASCIVLIPLFAWLGHFAAAGFAIGAVLVECVVLLFNRGRCPMTRVAERYTAERAANFDIYLPLWLARNNKILFGALFVVGSGVALVLALRAKFALA